MKIINNPLDDVFQAVENLYGNIDAEIWLDPELDIDKCEYGYTTFPDDKTTPIIQLSPDISIAILAEILAHELAHVVVGVIIYDKDDGHNEEWKEVFDKINKEYHRIIE